MLKDITLGQYFPGQSVIHRMDARVKLLLTVIYIALLFFVKNLYGFLAFGLFNVIIIAASGVPFLYTLKGLKPLLLIISLTGIINVFMTDGTPIFSYWFITATYEGVAVAVFMIVRLVLLMTGSSMLTFTTSPIALTDSLESLLKPFDRLRVPSHEIAMMMTIAMRFIPIITEETDKIMKAQMARGADFAGGNILRRGKALIPLLIPLFISAFRRADELALAMECRCYNGGAGRTRMKVPKLSAVDFWAIFAAVFLVGAIFLDRLGFL